MAVLRGEMMFNNTGFEVTPNYCTPYVGPMNSSTKVLHLPGALPKVYLEPCQPRVETLASGDAKYRDPLRYLGGKQTAFNLNNQIYFRTVFGLFTCGHFDHTGHV